LLVIPPADFRPTTWRAVPPASAGTCYTVVDSYEPNAVGTARAAAKMFNRRQMLDASGGALRLWAVLACTDGRYLAGQESEVRA